MLNQFKTLPFQVWLADHRDPTKISASSVPTILGKNPYCSPYELYHMLMGLVPWPKQNLAMAMGHTMEDIIAGMYGDARGVKLIDPGDYAISECAELPGLFCTVDRIDENDRVVECKTANQYVKKNWNEGAPIGYQVQNQVQMLCTGKRKGAIAALLGDNFKFAYGINTSKDSVADLMEESGVEYVDYDYDWHEPLSESILEACDKWLKGLKDKTPPDVEGRDIPIIKVLHPDDNGETVDGDSNTAESMACMGDLKADIKGAEKQKDDAVAKIINEIGDASYICVDGIFMSYKTQGRKAKLTIPFTNEHDFNKAKELLESRNVKYKETEASTTRVLRNCKAPE